MRARVNVFAVAVAALAVGAACNTAPETAENAANATGAAVDRTGDAVTDARITTTIQSKYFGSSVVKGHEIDVDTDNNVVTLTGKVQDENARMEAVRIASGVDGVSKVEDHLVIMTDADRTAVNRPDIMDTKSPGWITTKIQSQYYMHPGLKPWNIDVDTRKGGVVTLSGEIDSASDRAEAVKIASATDGVTRVEDHLHAKGEAASSTDSMGQAVNRAEDMTGDAWITSKIQARYFADNDVEGHEINVDTQNGVVTLKGSVESQSERNQAVAIARNTDGVKEVRNQLTIAPDTNRVSNEARRIGNETKQETKKLGDEAGRAVSTTGQKIDDAWITMKIQSKFFVADDIKSRKVDVDTNNGVVTLNGSVPTTVAREAAVQLAKETDGVTSVVSNLKIDPSQK
jgi:hyperosmotically inducible protein